ncbi:MAG: hypothetical protein IT374_25420 [Polyangiaceae bacterium]|nr:hypothetical protein [Polyangiaceae bacterium]
MSPRLQRTVSPLLALALAAIGACSAEQHDAAPGGTSTAGSAGGPAGASGAPGGAGGAAQAGAGGTQSEAGAAGQGGGGAPAADWKAPCKERPGAAMVRVPAPDGSTYCIDTTEVTI